MGRLSWAELAMLEQLLQKADGEIPQDVDLAAKFAREYADGTLTADAPPEILEVEKNGEYGGLAW
jgi:hypothetical protein